MATQMRQKKLRMKRISILAFENGIASTTIGPLEIFQYADILGGSSKKPNGANESPFFEVKIVTIDGQPVRCSEKVMIVADCSLDEIENTDLVLICSPGPCIDEFLRLQDAISPQLKELYAKGSSIAAICTGAFLLAETGILNGKLATTHWNFADQFCERYPLVKLKPERLITDEERVLCAGGVYSALDLALYLVDKYCGREIAVQCSKTLVIETGRHSQTGYSIFSFQKQHDDKVILSAQNWIENNFAQDFLFDDVAAKHAMSSRNFKRRFKKATGDSPLAYLQRFRIEAAKKMLEGEDATIEEIAHLVGYEKIDFFRQLFKRTMGITPKAYRQKFRFNERKSLL